MPHDITAEYSRRKEEQQRIYATLSTQHNSVTLARLVIMALLLYCIYHYYHSAATPFLLAGIVGVTGFLVLLKVNRRLAYRKQFCKNLAAINGEELAFIQEGKMPFDNGVIFSDTGHAYASDLDLFGDRSLFQFLNRTATYPGKSNLARALCGSLAPGEIKQRQEALAELSAKLDFRLNFKATALFFQDDQQTWSKLCTWAATPERKPGFLLRSLSFVLPILLGLSLGGYFFTKSQLLWDIALRIFPLNLLVMATQLKRIRQALYGTERMNELLKQYASLLVLIAAERWQTPGMQQLQRAIGGDSANAGVHIGKLSKICAGMETIQNPFGAVILNGLFLYHIHALNDLARWKQRYGPLVAGWLDAMGTVESMASFANLSYNNPGFVFPSINGTGALYFQDLGHPLIPERKRVCNDVSFLQQRFIILTGSNMSGKSTFLRTLGVNMVLAGAGSAVCATEASVHPMPVFVSMRQSDSLADSESYFFAEVKRLKYIMDQLKGQACFVLLDEILRGTNSDDKRSGTLGVIEKIISGNTLGAIATHDLEVCAITDKYPEALSNKCFEVEIIRDELNFDYKLREGICHNKSATFLMKKMEII